MRQFTWEPSTGSPDGYIVTIEGDTGERMGGVTPTNATEWFNCRSDWYSARVQVMAWRNEPFAISEQSQWSDWVNCPRHYLSEPSIDIGLAVVIAVAVLAKWIRSRCHAEG